MGCELSAGGHTSQPSDPNHIGKNGAVSYKRLELIGKGTYGQVYKCVNALNNLHYAMKVIKINAKQIEHIQKSIGSIHSEISVMKTMDHPNIVGYQSIELTANLSEVEIVTQLIEQGSLKQYIDRNGPLSENQTARICKDLLHALSYLHEQRIIHRDIRCANILLTSNMTPKLTDIGTVKILGEHNTDTCSLSYQAPEVVKKTGHSYSADIWSFGCTVIEMLSGKTPWASLGSDSSQIINYLSLCAKPPFPPNLSKDCNCFLESCLDSLSTQRLKPEELLKHKFIDREFHIPEQLLNYQHKPLHYSGEPLHYQHKPLNYLPLNYQDEPPNYEPEASNYSHKPLSQQHLSRRKTTNNRQSTNKTYQIDEKSIEIEQLQENETIDVSKQQLMARRQTHSYSAEPNLMLDHCTHSKQHSTHNKQRSRKHTQRYMKEVQKLERLQDEISEVSIEQQQMVRDYYIMKKAKANLKKDRRARAHTKTSAAIKNREENINNVSNDCYHRSNTEVTYEDEAINTAISMAERNRYIEEQKKLGQRRIYQKKKWEQQLRQGAQLLKGQFSSRYVSSLN